MTFFQEKKAPACFNAFEVYFFLVFKNDVKIHQKMKSQFILIFFYIKDQKQAREELWYFVGKFLNY